MLLSIRGVILSVWSTDVVRRAWGISGFATVFHYSLAAEREREREKMD